MGEGLHGKKMRRMLGLSRFAEGGLRKQTAATQTKRKRKTSVSLLLPLPPLLSQLL
jgi:hypothetical protein